MAVPVLVAVAAAEGAYQVAPKSTVQLVTGLDDGERGLRSTVLVLTVLISGGEAVLAVAASQERIRTQLSYAPHRPWRSVLSGCLGLSVGKIPFKFPV